MTLSWVGSPVLGPDTQVSHPVFVSETQAPLPLIPTDPSSTACLYNTPDPFLFEAFLINEQVPQHNSPSKTTSLDASAFCL